MQLKEFMTPNPHGIQTDDSSRHAAEQMRRHGFGAVPVYDQELLVGMLTDRDLTTGCIAAGHDAGVCTAREHMTADPVSIGPDATIEDALTKMADAQVRRLIVMGSDGVAGIVSLGDLAVRCADSALVGRTLAEISEPVRQPLRA
jgi:CBS domain-containing protein